MMDELTFFLRGFWELMLEWFSIEVRVRYGPGHFTTPWTLHLRWASHPLIIESMTIPPFPDDELF